tara:strand:- start:254 stop:439 length:186 start_codon:yes stop_codon:yes gene_type:complete
MAKNKQKITINVDIDTSKSLKRLQREEKVQAMREGRRQRAVVFANKRKQASKKACRGKVQW